MSLYIKLLHGIFKGLVLLDLPVKKFCVKVFTFLLFFHLRLVISIIFIRVVRRSVIFYKKVTPYNHV